MYCPPDSLVEAVSRGVNAQGPNSSASIRIEFRPSSDIQEDTRELETGEFWFPNLQAGTYYLGALSRVAAAARRDSTVNLGVALPGGVVDYRAPRSSNPRAIASAEGKALLSPSLAVRRGLFPGLLLARQIAAKSLVIQFARNSYVRNLAKDTSTKQRDNHIKNLITLYCM